MSDADSPPVPGSGALKRVGTNELHTAGQDRRRDFGRKDDDYNQLSALGVRNPRQPMAIIYDTSAGG